ncbi:AI-2E family transporter [Spiractinospora alimapuensis]|uniref:AI-2E family transporter n=1 Tax=Spiractinospora alimapuensis TaxID=2820884 RepID=UPI001F2348BD|nr:AI-2E family transporter [Spiractinospora alimapuensis]QVQ52438.1 AI-2E family transporter [Spiractinospora alimapuensis]
MSAPPPPPPPPEPEPPEEDDLLKRASDTAWRLLIVGAVGAIILWGLTYISTAVIPVVLAVFLTALMQPMATALRARGMGRGPSTAITFLGSLVLFGLVVYFIVDRAVAGAGDLVDPVSEFLTEVQSWLRGLGLDAELVNNFLNEAQNEVQNFVQNNLQENARVLAEGFWTGTVAVGQVLFAIVLLMVLTIYFLHSGDHLMKWIGSLFPGHTRRVLFSSSKVAYEVMGRYVRGVALVGLFDAIGIGLLLVVLSFFGQLPFNLALPLIVLTFIGAFLPVIGAFATGALATIVVLVTSGQLWIGLLTLAWVIFIQQLESNLFAPRVYGRALDLPSAVVLLGITVGAIVGNLVGMFLATPIVAVAAALLRNRPGARAEEHASDTGARSPETEPVGETASTTRGKPESPRAEGGSSPTTGG